MSAVRTGAGYAPTDPQHVATKAYVDSKAGSGGTTVGVPVFVQATQPSYSSGPYVWYQTNAAGQVTQVYVEGAGGALLSETWTGADGSSWPAAWTISPFGSPAGTSSTIQGNQGQLVPGSAAYSGLRGYRSGVSTGDANATVLYTPTTQGEQYAAVVLNADNTTYDQNSFFPQNGYLLQVAPTGTAASGTVTLYKMLGNAQSTLAAAQTVTLTAGTQYGVRLQRLGTTVRWRLWAASAAEPSTWNGSATDGGTQPSAGGFMLVSGNGNGTAPNVQNTTLWDTLNVTAS